MKSGLNIILPSKPESSKWRLILRFPHQNPVYASSLPIRAICSAHLILLDFITRTLLGERYRVCDLTNLKNETVSARFGLLLKTKLYTDFKML